jgi:hypothetical protein
MNQMFPSSYILNFLIVLNLNEILFSITTMDFVEVRVITGGFKNTNSDIVLVLRTATILIRSGLVDIG